MGNKKEIKKLEKWVDKFYFKNNQRLNICTRQYLNGKDYCIDVCLIEYDNERKDLFTIQTLDSFFNNLSEASYTPFYFDKVFTLKKFGTITEGDIDFCTRYFIKKVLKNWLPHNINIDLEYEIRSY